MKYKLNLKEDTSEIFYFSNVNNEEIENRDKKPLVS